MGECMTKEIFSQHYDVNNYCSMRPVLYNSDMTGVTSAEGTGNPWEQLSSPPVLVGFVLMDLSSSV